MTPVGHHVTPAASHSAAKDAKNISKKDENIVEMRPVNQNVAMREKAYKFYGILTRKWKLWRCQNPSILLALPIESSFRTFYKRLEI